MGNLLSDGRVLGLTSFDWAVLLGGMVVCGFLPSLF
jgi:hypothetical protein